MYAPAIRRSVTKKVINMSLFDFLGGQYIPGELIFLPKQKKIKKDDNVVRSGSSDEYLRILDHVIEQDENTRA